MTNALMTDRYKSSVSNAMTCIFYNMVMGYIRWFIKYALKPLTIKTCKNTDKAF
jgi:hypothetical protein